MENIKEKETPVGALTTWLSNIEGRTTLGLKGNGTMLDSLRILYDLGGCTIVKDLRHSLYHMREIQKLLVLGLIEQVPKDCGICSNRAKCLARKRRCAARHLYALTMKGAKAVHDLQNVTGSSFYQIDIQINPYWFEYFKKVIW